MPRSTQQETVYDGELGTVVSWINSLRERYSLTQNDFANRIGVSTTYVNMLIHKKRKPSLMLLRRIADEFNETASLRSVLPRAYERMHSFTSPNSGVANDVLTLSSSIEDLFNAVNYQTASGVGRFFAERIDDRGLEPWGIQSGTYCLSEQVTQSDLTTGELITYGDERRRHWGFLHTVGGEMFIISPGQHLKEMLQLTDADWTKSGFHLLDVNEYHLHDNFDTFDVRKVRFLLSQSPNLRTPLVSHIAYPLMRPDDRNVVDQLISRLTGYAQGTTGYQPSQRKRY